MQVGYDRYQAVIGSVLLNRNKKSRCSFRFPAADRIKVDRVGMTGDLHLRNRERDKEI